MINLAPNHKQGLLINNPVMLAGGSVGYGEAIHRGVQPEKLGAIVVGPILRHSRAGAAAPRLAETTGGLVLHTGLQNRGVSAVLKKFAKGWSRLGCPIIAQVADTDPDMLVEVVRRLSHAAMGGGTFDVELSAIELVVGDSENEEMLRNKLRVVIQETDLPMLLKLPLGNALSLAPTAAEMGISALVIGCPLRGAGVPTSAQAQIGEIIVGDLFGPLAFAPMMATLHNIIELDLPCTIIASGGIHSSRQAKQVLDAGAQAFQIDSALWVEPGLPAQIAEQLDRSNSGIDAPK